MWRFAQTPKYKSSQLEWLLTKLNDHSGFFHKDKPISAGRAPGRLDLMGGIADYSGALVLELPLEVATIVAVQQHDEAKVIIHSPVAGFELKAEPVVSYPLKYLTECESYAEANRRLTSDPATSWAAYVAGVLVVLQREKGLTPAGLRLLVLSEVPSGKGVGSSAALEVATMQAVCALYGLELQGRELAILCQKVENLVVGAPCGIMDQMTSACGEQERLLALLCQPAELQGAVVLPPEIAVWGIDSGVTHTVTGADYGSVRVGAFMGYRIIADLAGFPVKAGGKGRVEIEDKTWGGYLANISPSLWETTYRERIPESICGAEFLERYGGFTDSVTRIDSNRRYKIRQPTAHPIYEHHRVRLFRALLESGPLEEEKLRLLGELMYQSHASYSACGLGSAGTDRLVELVREAGPQSGLYGAKITGGGSGGTVAVLGRKEAGAAIEKVVAQYEKEEGYRPLVLSHSSPGAMAYGTLRLVQS